MHKLIDTFNVAEEITPFEERSPLTEEHLKVSDLHEIYIETYGNPEGVPVIVLHGGPGVGGDVRYTRSFDLEHYYVIMLDQRGAKRSKPFAELTDNNTQNLVNDLEVIRKHFGIEKWVVAGGSWGSTLALSYGQAFPERCLGFILRGIFLGTREEIDRLITEMYKSYPEYWEEMLEILDEAEKQNVEAAIRKRVMDPDPAIQRQAAIAFMKYDLATGTIAPNISKIDELLEDISLTLGVCKFFFHYAEHNFFLEDGQLLQNIGKISHLPCYIVHGRHDAITRLDKAYALHKKWSGSKLYIAEKSGHAHVEKMIEKGLMAASEEMKKRYYRK